MKRSFLLIILFVAILSCNSSKKTDNLNIKNHTKNKIVKLSPKAMQVRDYINKNIVIAHRGSTYWTPEETEPAFRWARNIGADYLELDLQMTKDSILVAMHDDNLLRTTNVRDVFPKIKTPTVNDFTLKELRGLDCGIWFNKKNPDRARKSFKGAKILTLKDVMMIAEGYCIKRVNGIPAKEIVDKKWTGKYLYAKDLKDNKNRPGIYAETKSGHGLIEKVLAKELKEQSWLITDDPKEIKTYQNKVSIANTNARFILQSFSKESIEKLEVYLSGIPKCMLLWKPDMKGDLKKNLIKYVDFCIKNNAEIMGSSIAGAPNNYEELTALWMVDLIHKSGMIIHPYTFDTNNDLHKYASHVEGVFTNRADLALIYYKRLTENTSEKVLEGLGY